MFENWDFRGKQMLVSLPLRKNEGILKLGVASCIYISSDNEHFKFKRPRKLSFLAKVKCRGLTIGNYVDLRGKEIKRDNLILNDEDLQRVINKISEPQKKLKASTALAIAVENDHKGCVIYPVKCSKNWLGEAVWVPTVGKNFHKNRRCKEEGILGERYNFVIVYSFDELFEVLKHNFEDLLALNYLDSTDEVKDVELRQISEKQEYNSTKSNKTSSSEPLTALNDQPITTYKQEQVQSYIKDINNTEIEAPQAQEIILEQRTQLVLNDTSGPYLEYPDTTQAFPTEYLQDTPIILSDLKKKL